MCERVCEMRKIGVLLSMCLFTIFLSSFVSAEGCCFTTTGCSNAWDEETCMNAFGSTFPDVPTSGALAWSSNECIDEPMCTDFNGCCCVDETNFLENVPEYTCIDTAATFYVGQSCSSVPQCSGGSGSQTYELSGQIYLDDGTHPVSTTLSLYEEGTQTTFEQTILGSDVYSFDLDSSYYYSIDANDGTCSAQIPLFQIAEDTVMDIVLDCSGGIGGGECSLEWSCTYPQLVNGVACGFPTCELLDPNSCCPGGLQGCDATIPPQPGFILCPDELPTCGNGVAEQGEQCDGADLRNLECTDLLGYTGGTLACDDQCRFDTSSCTNCPATVSGCNQLSQCDSCASVCGSAPICTQQTLCTDAPDNFDVSFVFGTSDAAITWDMAHQLGSECELALQGFDLLRCEELPGGGCGSVIFNSALDKDDAAVSYPTTFSYDDSSLAPQTSYCWQIKATYYDEVLGASESEIVEVCQESGNSECMNGQINQLCADPDSLGQLQPYSCDADNKLVEITPACAANEVCLGPDSDGEVHCSSAEVCDLCNGGYGMYSYLSFRLEDVASPLGGVIPSILCNEFPVSYDNGGSGYSPICYLKETHTVADSYDSCSEVTSCYDYRNEDSCLTNTCEHSFAQNCAWQPLESYGAELGIGVCAPSEPELENCARCHDNFLSPDCYDALCELHSNQQNPDTACYYAKRGFSDDDAEFMCLSKEDVVCSDYKTKDDCVGDSIHRVNDIWGAFADITYPTSTGGLQNIMHPDGGSHSFFYNGLDYTSHDLFAKGVCQWNAAENECVKNADNFLEEINNGTFVFADDCESLDSEEEIARCLTDKFVPTTSLNLRNPPIYSDGEGLSFSWSANDDVYISEELSTYFSLTPASNLTVPLTSIPKVAPEINAYDACTNLGGFCHQKCSYNRFEDGSYQEFCVPCSEPYPIVEGQLFTSAICSPLHEFAYPDQTFVELQSRLLGDGDYELGYYSHDVARNFEVVQTSSFTIDALAPLPTLVHIEDTPFNLTPDTWFSDVVITSSFSDANGPITCVNNLYTLGGVDPLLGSDTFVVHSNMQMLQQFSSLSDGHYVFSANCTDTLNNNALYSFDTVLEADKRIVNSQPVAEIFSDGSGITLSLNTERPAVCKYKSIYEPDFEHPLNGGHDFMSNANQTSHWSDLTFSPLEYNQFFVYYVGCDFGNGEIVEGNLGDIMYFSIDADAPHSEMIDLSTNLPYAPVFPTDEVRFKLTCDDYNYNLTIGDVILYYDETTIEYCLGSDELIGNMFSDPCTFEEWTVSEMLLTHDDIGLDSNTLFFRCSDGGGNTEFTRHERLFLRDLTFAEPCVKICDPLTNTCQTTGNCQ